MPGAADASGSYRRGLVLTAAGTLIVSLEALFVRLADVDAWTVIWWRGLLLGVTMMALIIVTGRSLAFRTLRLPALAAAMAFAAAIFFFVTALNTTTVANTLVMASAAPLFAALQGWLFLRERPTRATWAAAVVVFAGIAIIFSGSLRTSFILGDLLALGYAVCLAGFFVALRRCPDDQVLSIIAYAGLLSGVLAWPLASPAAITITDLWVLLALGAVIVPASTMLLSLGTRYIPASQVTLIMMLEMLLGPLWVWLVLSEVPALTTVVGGILVLVTVVAHSYVSGATRPAAAPE